MFDQASLWGLDEALLIERLDGDRLDETGALLTRLDGAGLNYYGVDGAVNDYVDQLMEFFAEPLEDSDFNRSDVFNFETFEAGSERLVLENVSLLPWSYSAIPAERLTEAFDMDLDEVEDLLPFLHSVQEFTAFAASIGYERSILQNSTYSMSYQDMMMDSSASQSIDLYVTEDAAGWDIGHTATYGTMIDQTVTYKDQQSGLPEDDPLAAINPFAGLNYSQTGRLEMSRVDNLRLNTLMTSLAQSELPSMDVKDLMSLGTTSFSGYSVSLNDKPIFSAASGTIDMSEWTWLVPNTISLSVSEADIGLSNFVGFVMDFFPDDLAAEDEEAAMILEGLDRAIDLLPEYGLDRIAFDGTLDLNWDADNGATDASYLIESDGNGLNEFAFEIDLPVYDIMVAAARSEDAEAEFQTAFEESFAFERLFAREKDLGGYDKLFGFANAIGAEYKSEGWGAMLSGMQPEQMRTYLATMIRMGKAEAERELPIAADWLESMAKYYELGGELVFEVAPDQPLNIEQLESFDDVTDPQAVIDVLNVSVTHNPN